MYADDSIMCCLFPNKCDLFPQTPKVIFSIILEYLNMMILLSSCFFIAWSSTGMMVQYVKDKKRKLIEQNDSDNSCLEEQSIQNKLEVSRTDENLSDENNSDGDGDQRCSDSDLNVFKSFKQQFDTHDSSNSDCYNSSLESSEEVVNNIDMTNQSRRSFNSVKRSCISSSSDEGEVFDHDIKLVAIHDSTLAVIEEEELDFLNVPQEDMNNDKPKKSVNLNIER